MKELCGMDYFRDVIVNHSTREDWRLFVVVKLKKEIYSNWDTLVDAPKYHLCLLGIASSDGKIDHAICVIGNWIFDSNLEHALPLCKESLDLCCSDNNNHNVISK